MRSLWATVHVMAKSQPLTEFSSTLDGVFMMRMVAKWAPETLQAESISGLDNL